MRLRAPSSSRTLEVILWARNSSTFTGMSVVDCSAFACRMPRRSRSEEHTSELQSLMRISYAVFCLKKKKQLNQTIKHKLATTENNTTLNSILALHILHNILK